MWGATGNTETSTGNIQFQSTLPVWGATAYDLRNSKDWIISIHAPRVGSDTVLYTERVLRIIFQSTLPVWGATPVNKRLPKDCGISIHAPRVGSDSR